MKRLSTGVSGTRAFAPVAILALVLMPVSVCAQEPPATAARNEVVWHWFGGCTGSDSLVLDVRLDGKPLYSSTFPICKTRRSQIKPEPEQRLLAFRFVAAPRRFGYRDRSSEPRPIAANIWEAGADAHSLSLGVSFSTEDQVLLNSRHEARVDASSRSERVRGLVITTTPVRRDDKTSPKKRST